MERVYEGTCAWMHEQCAEAKPMHQINKRGG